MNIIITKVILLLLEWSHTWKHDSTLISISGSFFVLFTKPENNKITFNTE